MSASDQPAASSAIRGSGSVAEIEEVFNRLCSCPHYAAAEPVISELMFKQLGIFSDDFPGLLSLVMRTKVILDHLDVFAQRGMQSEVLKGHYMMWFVAWLSSQILTRKGTIPDAALRERTKTLFTCLCRAGTGETTVYDLKDFVLSSRMLTGIAQNALEHAAGESATMSIEPVTLDWDRWMRTLSESLAKGSIRCRIRRFIEGTFPK